MHSVDSAGDIEITVVVPTYREVESLPHLLPLLLATLRELNKCFEVLIVDDNSKDGSEEVVQSLNAREVVFLTRIGKRGLSAAVLDAFKRARGQYLVCMDADLSHPPEKIPELLAALIEGADFVMGSRYVPGGSTDAAWSLFRHINSRVATLLARPLTRVRDPMSGFFALRRATFDTASELNPVGYKIALELIVKCACKNVVEIPIHFADRRHGKSKLSLKEQLLYIQHIQRLYRYKIGK